MGILPFRVVWDPEKDERNQRKHGVSFFEAQRAFLDKNRIIALDVKHSTDAETRFFCFGKIDRQIMTVRFTVRSGNIRIYGAGYWREGRRRYEQENRVP